MHDAWADAVPRPATPTNLSSQQPSTFRVNCPAWVYRILWLLFLAFHVVCTIYYLLRAWIHRGLSTTYTGLTLHMYSVIIDVNDYATLAYFYGVFAVIHILYVLTMLLSSIYERSLVYQIHSQQRSPSPKLTWSSHLPRVRGAGLIRRLWSATFGRRGFFGVEGAHFELSLLVREVIEISLESYQAYRLSCWAPRPWLNRLYACMLAVNCWSTPMIQLCLEKNAPLSRMLCIMCDLVLDFLSVAIIPAALATVYAPYYDPTTQELDDIIFYDDYWIARVLNETKLVIITSWADFLSDCYFSAAIFIGLSVIKSLLSTSRRVTPVPSASAQVTRMRTEKSISSDVSQRRSDRGVLKIVTSMKAMHILSMVWGLLVLVFHFYAAAVESGGHWADCRLPVSPWFSGSRSCALIWIDCRKLHIDGTDRELSLIFDHMNSDLVASVVFRHCPALQVPPAIKTYHDMFAFKIYNSTIERWDDTAGVTADNHPKLAFMNVILTNISEIPAGLLLDNFPQSVMDFAIAGTNLTTLPDKIARIWPRNILGQFDFGQFEEVPPVIYNMSIDCLSFVEAKLSHVPPDLLTRPDGFTLWLSGNPISELPENITQLTPTLRRIRIVRTNVSQLPGWMNETFFTRTKLFAGFTPFCVSLKANMSSNATRALVPTFIQNAYHANRIDCNEVYGDDYTYYDFGIDSAADDITV